MSVKNLLYESKVPSTRKNCVGVEIEFLIPGNQREKLKQLLLEEKLQWNVHLGTDGSVHDDTFVPKTEFFRVGTGRNSFWTTRVINEHERPRGCEMRLLATEKEMPELINKVCDIIKKCKGYVNKTCGLHVHIDMRNRDINTIYNNFYAIQSIMFNMQPKSRRDNEYCEYLSREKMKNVNADLKNALRNDDDDFGERHYSINKMAYARHGTLEVRLHEGTIDAVDIRRWVYFLIKFSDLPVKLTKKINNLDGLDLPDKIKEYVNDRIKKFAG